MMMNGKRLTLFTILWILLVTAPAVGQDDQGRGDHEPVGMLLTWQQDPTTTMTIDWQTEQDDEAVPILRYKKVDNDDWIEIQATQHEFPYSDRNIHRVELTGLEPDTYYHFNTGEFIRTYKFRTMPENIIDEPVVFAAGGDTRVNRWTFEPHYHEEVGSMEDLNRIALEYDVDFIAWGGDFAYADGLQERLHRWYWWFEANMNSFIDWDGRVVPVVAAIGNHEIRQDFNGADDYEPTESWRRRNSPYFFSFFAFPGQPGYGVLDFGDYLSMIALDSDLNNPIDGLQSKWLEEVLAERNNVPHIFPFYHTPAFPSHRNPGGDDNTRVREIWVPLFEKYGVQAAFEHDDHTYKRTHPIRNGKVDLKGITYIGDGAYGRGPRTGNSKDEWYINKFATETHVIITTIHGGQQHFLMVNHKGEIIDEYPQTAKRR